MDLIKDIENVALKKCLEELKEMAECAEGHLMDGFLELLLKALKLVFEVDKNYRRNIENFTGSYAFCSQDGKIGASAIFKDAKMTVKNEAIKGATVTVVFKDGKALADFLFSGNPDVFAFVLANKLSYEGNLNYLLKFAYMAMHLKTMIGL